MARIRIQDRSCPNESCPDFDQAGQGNIVVHGFAKLQRDRRRRYRCTSCGKTFNSTRGTPYYGLQCSQRSFELVVRMSVEGMSKSSIARITGLSWNTVARWLERAAAAAVRFNEAMMWGYELKELQADELRTFVGRRDDPTWVFTAIEVWSRLWVSKVVGRRSYRNTRILILTAIRRGLLHYVLLVTTDGFVYYKRVVERHVGHGCVYGQVMKTWRKNRVVKVDRVLIIGSGWQLEEALSRSEDSTQLNTSFIERLNLTLRQGSAYLNRRTPCHARCAGRLEDQVELFRCYYNFVRPHRALKFGELTKTPAMQAGLMSRKLTFRDIFTWPLAGLLLVVVLVDCRRASGKMEPVSRAA